MTALTEPQPPAKAPETQEAADGEHEEEQTAYAEPMPLPVTALVPLADAGHVLIVAGSDWAVVAPKSPNSPWICTAGLAGLLPNAPAAAQAESAPGFIVAAAASGRLVAMVTDSKHLVVYEISADTVQTLSVRPLAKRPTAVAFARGDADVLVANKYGDVTLFGARTAAADEPPVESRQPLLGHVSAVHDVVVLDSPARARVLTADHDEHVRVSRFPRADVIEGFCLGHTAFVGRLCLFPEQRWVASAAGDGTLRLWSVDTQECLSLLKVDELLPAEDRPRVTAPVALVRIPALVNSTALGALVLTLDRCRTLLVVAIVPRGNGVALELLQTLKVGQQSWLQTPTPITDASLVHSALRDRQRVSHGATTLGPVHNSSGTAVTAACVVDDALLVATAQVDIQSATLRTVKNGQLVRSRVIESKRVHSVALASYIWDAPRGEFVSGALASLDALNQSLSQRVVLPPSGFDVCGALSFHKQFHQLYDNVN